MATANFGTAPVAGVAAADVLAGDVSPNAAWGVAADESFILATDYWTKINAMKTLWNEAAIIDNVAGKVAALKKLPYLVDLVPRRGGSRRRRQSKKRRNHKNHNNNQ
jgi:hypothetical protein